MILYVMATYLMTSVMVMDVCVPCYNLVSFEQIFLPSQTQNGWLRSSFVYLKDRYIITLDCCNSAEILEYICSVNNFLSIE